MIFMDSKECACLSKIFSKWFTYVIYDFFYYYSFYRTIVKGLAMCLLGGMITSQKEHIINNNCHAFHILWVVIMPKTPN